MSFLLIIWTLVTGRNEKDEVAQESVSLGDERPSRKFTTPRKRSWSFKREESSGPDAVSQADHSFASPYSGGSAGALKEYVAAMLTSDGNESPDKSLRSYNKKLFRAHTGPASEAGDTGSEVSASDMYVSENETVKASARSPSVLVGWRVIVKGRGSGLVVEMVKRRFMTTRFKVDFDNGVTEVLALQRSLKKGSVPFILISKEKLKS